MFSTALDAAIAGVEGALTAGTDDLSDTELADATTKVCGLIDRVDALGTAVVADFDGRMVWGLDGARSCGAWLRAHGELDGAWARSALATKLRLFAPKVFEALRSGALTHAKAKALMGVITADVAKDFAVVEEDLVEVATHLPVEDVEVLARQWRSLADDANDIDRCTRERRQRGLRLRQDLLGTWCADATFTADDGARLNAAVEARAHELFREDLRDARLLAGVEHDPDDLSPGGLELARTATQRRADALIELVCGMPAPSVSPERLTEEEVAAAADVEPPVTIEAHLTLAPRSLTDRQPGDHPRAHRPDAEPPRSIVDRLSQGCRHSGGGRLLTRDEVEHLACDAKLLRILVSPEGLPLDVGRAQRLVTPAIRRALVARDHHCAFPGCRRHAKWCHAHHIVWWEDHGPTSLENTALLCPHHHRAIHQKDRRFSVRMGADGFPQFFRPDGSRILLPHQQSPPERGDPHGRAS